MTESELRKIVVDHAIANGWLVFSLPIAKTRRPVKNAVGYPDLTLARHGRVLWFELKGETGIVSHAQDEWFRELGEACYLIRPGDMATVEYLLR